MSKTTNPSDVSASGQTPLDIQVVAADPELAIAALKPLFEDAVPPVTFSPGHTVAQALETSADAPVLVVRKAPVLMLAETIKDGAAPSKAVAASRDELEDFLAAARRARSRVLLLDETCLFATPQALSAGLGQRLKTQMSDSGDPEPATVPDTPPELALCLALAPHILKQDRKLRSLSDQVSAMALGADDTGSADLSLLDRAFAERQADDAERQALAKDVVQLGEERAELDLSLDLLKDNVKALSASMAEDAAEAAARINALVVEKTAVEEDCARQQDTIARLQAEIDDQKIAVDAAAASRAEALAAENAALEDTISRLSDNILQLHDQMEKDALDFALAQDSLSAAKTLAEEKATLEKTNARLSENIAQLRAEAEKKAPDFSRIQKRLSAAEARAAEKAKLEETNARLRENIAQLRSQLERDALDFALAQKGLSAAETHAETEASAARDREATLAAALLHLGRDRDDHGAAKTRLQETNQGLHRRIKTLEYQCAKLEDTVAQAETRFRELAGTITEDKEARDGLQQALDDARAELDHVYNSKSWKVATAMRSVRHGLKK